MNCDSWRSHGRILVVGYNLCPRINQQDRQKITFPGSANPKEISQQYNPVTHTEKVHCQRVLLGVFIPVSDH